MKMGIRLGLGLGLRMAHAIVVVMAIAIAMFGIGGVARCTGQGIRHDDVDGVCLVKQKAANGTRYGSCR